MPDLIEALRFLGDLGPYWAPLVVALVFPSAVIWLRWKRNNRTLRELLLNWEVAGTLLVCMLALAAYFVYLEFYWGLPETFDQEQTGILIAEIPGDVNRQQQNSYADAILRFLAEAPGLRDTVKVRFLRRPLSVDPDKQHEEALRLGRRLRAALVIRPLPTAGGHSPWVTIVDQPEFGRGEAPLGTVSQSQLAELDKLPLPGDVVLLARCAVALSYYRRGDHEQASQHFSQILAAPELPSAAPPRAYLNLLLGNSYVELSSSDPAALLSDAIRAYDVALRDWSRERSAIDWAGTMNNRGAAYGELPGPDRAANLREAIRSFELALEVYTRDRYPTEWAMIMNNRGAAYGQMQGPDRAANLREAIRSFDLALEVYRRKHHPREWASAMNNRGNAYRELPGPDRAANLREAIRSFDLALQVLTRDRYPTDWAMTMNNRGAAYSGLPGPDRAANLQETIRSHDLALEVYTRERYPTEWAMTMYNRGVAYGQLPGPDRAANLQEAIRSLDLALEVYTRERYPTDWADAMTVRGAAYRELPGPDRAANLREAIRCHDLALEVRTREQYPTKWAMSMNSRGIAYAELPGPHREQNLREAVRCFEEALEVFEAQGFANYVVLVRENLERSRRELSWLVGTP